MSLDLLRNSTLTSFESKKMFPLKVLVLSRKSKWCLLALRYQVLHTGVARQQYAGLPTFKGKDSEGRKLNFLIPPTVAGVWTDVPEAPLCKGETGCC